MPWKDGDLTAQAHAPPAAGPDSPVAYTTNLDGQGPVARVLYWGDDLHIHELSLASGSRWQHTDLTDSADAPTASGAGSFAGYTTNLAGQRPVARVVFKGGDHHVHELSLRGSAEPWQHADLSDQADAPAAATSLVGYTTNLAGQGPVARVLFWGGFDDDDIHELSLAGGGRWQHSDLTTNAQAPVAAGSVRAYTTNLAGQGPVARVLYSNAKDSHIHELRLTGGSRWQHTDLTVKANAPAWGDPWGCYTTNLHGQGPVARVLHVTQDLHLDELFLLGGGEPWKHGDLTAQAHAPKTSGSFAPYTTNLAGQGPVARIAYRGSRDDSHIHELSLSGGSRWQHTDLTDKANAPDAFGFVAAYTTNLAGQGPVARVLYRTNNHHIHELFTFR
jgi:hypothetical protein